MTNEPADDEIKLARESLSQIWDNLQSLKAQIESTEAQVRKGLAALLDVELAAPMFKRHPVRRRQYSIDGRSKPEPYVHVPPELWVEP
jgi:hypothetical protein